MRVINTNNLDYTAVTGDIKFLKDWGDRISVQFVLATQGLDKAVMSAQAANTFGPTLREFAVRCIEELLGHNPRLFMALHEVSQSVDDWPATAAFAGRAEAEAFETWLESRRPWADSLGTEDNDLNAWRAVSALCAVAMHNEPVVFMLGFARLAGQPETEQRRIFKEVFSLS